MCFYTDVPTLQIYLCLGVLYQLDFFIEPIGVLRRGNKSCVIEKLSKNCINRRRDSLIFRLLLKNWLPKNFSVSAFSNIKYKFYLSNEAIIVNVLVFFYANFLLDRFCAFVLEHFLTSEVTFSRFTSFFE